MKTVKYNLLTTILLATFAIPALAGNLNSSASVPLTLPSPCPGPACGVPLPGIFPTMVFPTFLTFNGTWSTPVAAPWLGHFSGTGNFPDAAHPSGSSTWDFSYVGDPNGKGFLPVGTLIELGDLDGFTGDEQFDAQAYDMGGLITSPWLDQPVYCSYQTGFSGDCVQGSMPNYSWTVGTGTYNFDGNPVNPGFNPAVGVWLKTTTPIYALTLDKAGPGAGLYIAAPTPTPEPGSLLLLGSSILGLGGFLRRRLLG